MNFVYGVKRTSVFQIAYLVISKRPDVSINAIKLDAITIDISTRTYEGLFAMWIIQAKSKHTGTIRRVVCSHWPRVMQLAEAAMAKGWKVTINQYFTDVLIARSTGEFIVAAQKICPKEAARLSVAYSRIDRERGLVLWPHGQQLPDGWNIIPREAI